MILNHALFADTPGYVLKPPALRSKLQEPQQTYQVRVKVISAQRLPLSSDLFVEARMGSQTRRTTMTQGTTLNPIWNDSLNFTITTTASMLSLTFLHLQIRNRQLVAQWVKPISQAPRGYHHLPLYDSLLSRYVFATLFVRVDVLVVEE
jgi:phosphatidylinositol phospholipase C delta